jgi:hypothetical protein
MSQTDDARNDVYTGKIIQKKLLLLHELLWNDYGRNGETIMPELVANIKSLPREERGSEV